MAVIETLLFSGFFGNSVAEASSKKSEKGEDISKYTDSAVENLDVDAFQRYLNELSEESRNALGFSDVKAMLRTMTSGTPSDFYSAFIDAVKNTVGKYFVGFLPAMLTVIVICLLKNLLSGMTSGFLDNSTTEVVHVVCYSVIVVLVTSSVASVVASVVGTIENLYGFSEAVFPVLLTLMTALGGRAVGTYGPLMAALSGGVLTLLRRVIVPVFIACVVFSVVGNMSKDVKLTKLCKLFRSGAGWLLGIVFGLFGTFLTLGGISGGVVDRVGYNAAKFAVSSYVPILGGYLSDGFDLVTASLTLVKNALGYTGVLVLIAVVLFPLLKLVIFLLTLRLTAAVVEPIGDERVSNMLTSVADNSALMISALAGTAFLFFVIILLVMTTFNYAV